jgi:hypothetical protein
MELGAFSISLAVKDVPTSRAGIVNLTLNRQAPPPMRRRAILQLQTQVSSRQTPQARVRKSR